MSIRFAARPYAGKYSTLALIMAIGAQAARASNAADERSFRSAAFILFALTVLRLVWLASGVTDLCPNEAQYWLWSLHPAWGYYSKPPLVAWLIAATTRIGNADNEFAVRLAAPLLQFCTALVVYALARRLYDARVAFWSSVAYATVPGAWVSAVIISTGAPLLLCWAVALYAFVRAREPRGERWWWAVGLAAGTGLLATYAMAYWLLSALLFLLIHRDERRHLRRFAGAAALAVLVYSPNFVWNADNDFVSYRHTEANASLGGPLLHPLSFLEFFVSQFGGFGPVFFAVLCVAALLGRRQLARKRESLLACFALPTLGIMLVASLLSRAEPNWAAPTYVSACVLVIGILVAEGRRLLLWGSVALHVASVVVLAELQPISHAFGYELPGKYDPLHRLHGWRRLGDTVGRLLAENPGAVLMTNDRETTAALLYYVPQHPFDALKWNGTGGVHDEFDLTADPARQAGADFLLVSSRDNIDDILARFASAGPIERITIPLGPGLARTYQVRLLHGFKGYR